MRRINIALDGYAGCGKSTTAQRVAAHLGYVYVDTGAMYRAFTLFLLEHGISFQDTDAVRAALPLAHISFSRPAGAATSITLLNGEDVQQRIRTLEISRLVSEVSAIKWVRQAMVAQQQRLGRDRGMVMDGRDIGTVVFPDAELKVFMTASLEARVARRMVELQRLGQNVNPDELRENLQHRDFLDSTRTESPLRRADDARLLDTTHISIDEQVEMVTAWALSLIQAPVSVAQPAAQ